MTTPDLVHIFLWIATLLIAGRFAGDFARRYQQPPILGEIIAGILLGPTFLSRAFPSLGEWVSPSGSAGICLSGFLQIAVTLFLFVAGLKLPHQNLFKHKGAAAAVSLGGVLVPFSLGFIICEWHPEWLGFSGLTDLHIFSAFLGLALAISALPVIARTLMDLDLYDSEIGATTIAAALIDDLIGWIGFAFLLSLVGISGSNLPLVFRAPIVIGFALCSLLVFPRLWSVTLSRLKQKNTEPGLITAICISAGLLGGAFTEWLGIHSLFGAFMTGTSLSISQKISPEEKVRLDPLVSSFFGPIFFVSIGIKVDLLTHFNLSLVLIVVGVACVGKIFGCWLAARVAGIATRPALAIGICMNARGAMEIVFATVALEHGIIPQQLFVALVCMSLVTSVMVGPMLRGLGYSAKTNLKCVSIDEPKAFKVELSTCARAKIATGHQ